MIQKRRQKIQIPRSKYDTINESRLNGYDCTQVMTESTTMSDSFVEREKKEREKLRLSTSNQLREDLHSIFEREEHYDLTFVYKKIRWNVHTALLQQRAPVFYNHVKDCGDEVSLTFLAEEDYDSFGNWLRALYTEDNLDKYEAIVKEWISNFKKSNEEKEKERGNDNHKPNSFTENKSVEMQPSSSEDGTQENNTNEHWNINKKPSLMEEISHVQQQENFANYTRRNVNVVCTEKVNTHLPSVPECCSKLGNDLISTLINGEGTDLELRVFDGAIRVHKFMVSGRTHYFAAMLSGAWCESSNSYIYLPNFSLSALVSTLYYIYGGVLDIPQTASICEVLFLADMYNLQGLKDVIMLRLKRENCHFFHKPCTDCLAGVPEALALSVQFHETNFSEACLRWMTKHFVKVWRSKSFAAMGKQLMEVCYENALEELKPDSVIALVTQSDKLLETLPRVKWNEPLVDLVERLRDAALDYIAENFTIVSRHKNFQPLLQGMGWSCNLLELMFNKVVAALVAEKANSVFLSANYLKKMAENEELSSSVSSLLVEFYFKCYTYMVSNANHQILIDDWNNLPEDLKIKIKQDAVYVDERKKTLVPKPKLSSASRAKQKPPQVEKPVPASLATRSVGARPKIRTAPTKPTEPPSKPSKAASTAQTATSLKIQSTKSKEVSIKSRKPSAKSNNASTEASAKPKKASTIIKSTADSATSKEASAKSKEPPKVEKLSRRPPTSAGVLNVNQPIQEKKVHTSVKSRRANSAQKISPSASSLQKPSIDKKDVVKTRPVKQVSSKASTSLKPSKPINSASGSSSTRVQNITRPPHCKPASSEKLGLGKVKSKDVTDTKLKTATRKKAEPTKSNPNSKTQVDTVMKSKAVTSPTNKVSTAADTLDKEASMASIAGKKADEKGDKAEKGETSAHLLEDVPKTSDITESNVPQMSYNSEESDEVNDVKEVGSDPSVPDADDFTAQYSGDLDNSIVDNADDLLFSNTSISETLDEGLSTAAEKDGDDNKAIDNILQISSQSTEERSHSSSQLPSETAIKCDDDYDQKSNNTEASDIARDDDDLITTSDNEGAQFDEEEEGTCDEELLNQVEDESNNKESLIDNVNERNEDLDVHMDITPDAREEIVNESPERNSDVECEVNGNVDDGIQAPNEYEIDVNGAADGECLDNNNVENQEVTDAFAEQVTGEIETDVNGAADGECLYNNNVENQEVTDAFAEQVTGEIEADVNDATEGDGANVKLPLTGDGPSVEISNYIGRSNELIENEMVGDTITDPSQMYQQNDVEDRVYSQRELPSIIEENAEIEHATIDIESTVSVPDCERGIDDQNISHELVNVTDDSIPLEPALENDKDNEEDRGEDIKYGQQDEEKDEVRDENCLQLESEVKDYTDNNEDMNVTDDSSPLENDKDNEEDRGEDIKYGQQDEEKDEVKDENCLQLESEVKDYTDNDEDMMSDDNPYGSTKPMLIGVHKPDSSKESHPEEKDGEAGGRNERFILSKALQFGTTNGVSSVTSSN